MGSCCGGNAPTPPNPIQTAAAQTGTNVSTAVANAFLNNTNQVTPTGTLTYNPTGNFSWSDPTTGQTYSIPRFTSTQELSPAQQQLQTTREGTQQNLGQLASDQSGRISNLLSNPIDTSAAPLTGDPGQISGIPGAATEFGDAGNILRDYGANDFSADRSRVEQSLFERMQPQLDRQRNQLEQRLADQGIRYGSSAYTAAMDDFNRQLTDTRLAITAQGGQEQKLQADMAAQRAGFANAAEQQAFQQVAARSGFRNTALAQQVAQAQAAFSARNAARTQYMQEQYALRNQPINEISALLSGSQVQQPSFMQTPQYQIPTTDYAGLINQNFQQQFQNYQTQQQATSQLLGGILGAGSNLGAAAIRYSDRRLKENIHRIGTVFAAEPQSVQEPERKKLPIYEYAYKDDPASTRHVGPMAQDVERIDPGAVGKDKRGMRYLDAPRVMGSILRAV